MFDTLSESKTQCMLSGLGASGVEWDVEVSRRVNMIVEAEWIWSAMRRLELMGLE